MRFIRDIIAEKTQAAGHEEAAALHQPLRLSEQDRTDIAPAGSERINIEAQAPVSHNPVSHDADPTAPLYAPDTPAPQMAAQHAAQENPHVDLAAITAALDFSAQDAPADPAPQPPQQPAALPEDSFFDAGLAQEDDRLEDDPLEEALMSEDALLDAPFDLGDDGLHPTEASNVFADQHAPEHIAPEPTIVAPTADPAPAHESAPAYRPEPEQAAAPEVLPDPMPEPQPAPQPAPAATEAAAPDVDLAALQANVAAHKPASGRGSKGRVKTRLLGFSAPSSQAHDPLASSAEAPAAAQAQFPVGWLVVVDGPGKGASFSLFDGLTQIGRGEGQTVRLDFGDNTISRDNHAAIAFDGEQRRFFFGHGGKANLVRLNGQPVLSTEVLAPNSTIRIGETTLRFVALCGEDFSWGDSQTEALRFG